MVLIAPKKPELWLDLARLNEATGALGAAQPGLSKPALPGAARNAVHNEAALGLHTLKRRLH